MVNKLVLPVCVIALTGFYALQTPAASTHLPTVPYDSPVHAPIAASDTLTYFISSGEILIVNLPDLYRGFDIERYEIRSAPALSWLVERSFFWRTLGKETGSFDIVFDAISGGQPVNELVLAVNVQ